MNGLKKHIIRKSKSLSALPLKWFGQPLLNHRWKNRHKLKSRPHNLNAPLVVSLTSYPPRFPLLYHTLRTLLTQTVRPDQVMLWVYKEDKAQLPPDILALQKEGLTVAVCDNDTKSFKKVVHTLEEHPETYTVTADDDICYRSDWLEELLAGYRRDDEILCLRAHLIRTDTTNKPLPYRQWEHKTSSRGPSTSLFFTSGAGVLFPPHSMPDITWKRELFSRLTPHADDVWLNWMAQAGGCKVRRVGNNRHVVTWKGADDISLWAINKTAEAGNDVQIARVIDRFGFPASLRSDDKAV